MSSRRAHSNVPLEQRLNLQGSSAMTFRRANNRNSFVTLYRTASKTIFGWKRWSGSPKIAITLVLCWLLLTQTALSLNTRRSSNIHKVATPTSVTALQHHADGTRYLCVFETYKASNKRISLLNPTAYVVGRHFVGSPELRNSSCRHHQMSTLLSCSSC